MDGGRCGRRVLVVAVQQRRACGAAPASCGFACEPTDRRGVVERAQQPGHVTHREIRPGARLERSLRFALEVEHQPVVAHVEHLAEVEVAVHALPLGCARQGPDLLGRALDGRAVPLELRHGVARPGEPLEQGGCEPVGSLLVGHGGVRARERDVHACRHRTEPVRLGVERRALRGAFARQSEAVVRVGDEGRGDPQVAGHRRLRLGEVGPGGAQPRQRRGHARVALLDEPSRHVDVRVLSGLDRAQDLEDRARGCAA